MCAKRAEALSRHRSKQNAGTIFCSCRAKLLTNFDFALLWTPWEHSADVPLLSGVHISFYEDSFKCKLEPNNINNQAVFWHWKQSQPIQMCLQYNKSWWFCNNLCACVCEHLSIYMSAFPTVQQGEVQGRDLTLSRVFITSSCFRFISPNCTFLEKSLYCDFLLLLWSPRSPTIAFPLWHFASFAFLLFLPPVQSLATLVHRPPLLPLSSASPLHLSLSLLSSYTQHRPLTHKRSPPPPPASPLPWSTYFQLFFMLKKTVV